jgi:hypothetical protein
MGSYLDWTGTPVDAEAMIDAFITKAKVFQDPTTTYTLAEIYTKATPTSPSILEVAKSLAVVGTSAAGGIRKAVQATFNFKTTAGNPLKVIFLDYPHGSSQFDKQYPVSFSSAANDLVDEMRSTANAWAGRDKTRPAVAISVTNTLNEALRKQYRMG